MQPLVTYKTTIATRIGQQPCLVVARNSNMVKNGFSTPTVTLAAYGHEPIANLMQMGSENVRPETVTGLYTVNPTMGSSVQRTGGIQRNLYSSVSAKNCNPTAYSKSLKDLCPDVYTYPADHDSEFTCPNGTDYKVVFCPN
ncbi:hypothetical protein Dsin_014279 [Dipteronia sinensis]|uniref:Thaumatin-like protein n=1 Tax=Dipteronia sinensis TaxID=43782 RepID=A0AAE0AMR7_9ROSI|nr:hypothetical protein Dsin_014279 [Dipteronia sinensis]